MATQWPVVHARLVDLLSNLGSPWSGVSVFDGPPVTARVPDAFCTVGFVSDEEAGGAFTHDRAGNGFQLEETGHVRCELVTQSGPTNLATVRARAFELIDALEAEIRRDQTLGVLPQGSTTNLAVDVLPVQTTNGAMQRLTFSLNYFTRT